MQQVDGQDLQSRIRIQGSARWSVSERLVMGGRKLRGAKALAHPGMPDVSAACVVHAASMPQHDGAGTGGCSTRPGARSASCGAMA